MKTPKNKKKKYIKVLNIIGMKCPDPILIIRKTLKKMKRKKILLVIADDISTKYEIPIFCHFMKHKLLKKKIDKIPYTYLIKNKK
ncbi:Sulfur carrier protein TusA [Buchnera aphidicola (Tetraneura ulmi)]|uniref:sulfurtransferase TusA n=1 Tax=Buchnera aphidicola TaxID=9 RepID=UPI003463C64B